MTTYGIDAHLLLRDNATGVPRYARLLIEEMMRSPLLADETVVLYGHGPKPDDLVLAPGFSWRVVPWPLGRGWTHGGLSVELLRHPPSVLFVPGHEVPAFSRRKTKVVTTIHDVAFRRVPGAYPPRERARQELAVKQAVNRADRIIVPSEATKLDLAEFYGVDFSRVVVTHLAPTLPRVATSDAVAAFHLRPGQYFLYVGRLEAKKNTAELVRAFGLLKTRLGFGNPQLLVLAGTFGYGEDEIRRAITDSGVASDIRVLGYVPDEALAELMHHALAVVLPSKAEGFGIPVLEAMAAGVPVIASDVPALREVAGEAAVFVLPSDVSSLVEAMQRMVFDGGLREMLVASGAERVKAFSWEACATETWKALRGV